MRGRKYTSQNREKYGTLERNQTAAERAAENKSEKNIRGMKMDGKNREEQEYHFRHEQRLKRLQDSGVSADEFNNLMEQRRSAYTSKRKKGRGNRHLKFK